MLPSRQVDPVAIAGHAGAPGRLMAAGLATTVLAVAAAGLTVLPRAGRPVAILSGASAGLVAAVGAAGGTVLATPSAHVTVAMPGDVTFVPRLRRLGYVLVLDADAAAACGMFTSVDGNPDAQ